MAKKDYQTPFSLPIDFDESQRETVARMIMDKIRENTAQGMNRSGGFFPKYSDEYKNSLEFEIAGKSTKVNLELSGDMMVSMELISSKVGQIVIGYTPGSDMAGQVEGNQIGSYGKSMAQPTKARPFLGIPQKQLDLIIAQVRNETENDVTERGITDLLISSLLSRFK